MKPPVVYIIILNWNSLQHILECLESVYKLKYTNFEVIVVDNGSKDNSPEVIRKNYPHVTLIRNNRNYGFVGGNNIGMQYAFEHNADYMWLLNNDTVVEEDCLSKIIEIAESSDKIGMVSPMIYYFEDPKKWQFGGSYINWKEFRVVYPDKTNEIADEFQVGENVCLWGTALLIKHRLIEKIGYLKEEYFAYWEDTEYSLRALSFGFKNVVCSSTKVFHKGQPTNIFSENGKQKYFYYFMNRNKILLGNEYIRGKGARLSFKISCLGEVSEVIGRCHQDYVEPSLRGIWHGLKNISGPIAYKDAMPKLYKKILIFMSKYHPVFISDVLRFDLKEICRKIVRRERWSGKTIQGQK